MNPLYLNFLFGTWFASSLLSYIGIVMALSYFGIVDARAIPFLKLIPISYVVGLTLTLLLRYFWNFYDEKLWNRTTIIIGSLFLLIGHFGPASLTILMYTMKTGSASGLLLIPPIIITVVGYGIGFLLFVLGIIQNRDTTPNKKLHKDRAKNARPVS